MVHLLMALILALGLLHNADPPLISVQNITWYYGVYPEAVYNGSVVYVGPGISNNVTLVINYQGQLPINVTYTLSIGNYTVSNEGTLSPGTNTINITTPALSTGLYKAKLTISSSILGFEEEVNFSVNTTTPTLVISTNVTALYSGVPQTITLNVVNGTPIPIKSATITITPTNAYISPAQSSLTPPSTLSLTITPGPYSLRYAELQLNVTYIDAGGYEWSRNYTVIFSVVKTPVSIVVKTSSTAPYGTYMPITITATTPVGYLTDQPLSIYVDGNYITTVVTNNYGEAEYQLPVNFTVGYHTLTVEFMNNTYFEEVVTNYTFVVIPGTIQIMPYINSSEIMYGQSIYLKITLSPAVSSGTLTVSYTVNGQTISIGGYTPVNGVVELTWTPPQAGVYVLTLYYTNPPNYLPSSYNVTIIVNKASCTLRITVSGNLTVLHAINIMSTMSPPIVNAPVTLRIVGVGEATTATVNINSSGYAVYTFIPTSPGTYTVNAYWGGNINYNACNASLILTVNKASSTLKLRTSSNIAVVGDHLGITINILTDIPSTYLYGNLTIIIRNLTTNSTKTLNLTIKGASTTIYIPMNTPGSYELLAMYGGNTYIEPAMSNKIYINVIPGLFGIPWYVLIAYLAPLIAGLFIGIALGKYLNKSQ